jgi:L-amino acid N-acyltransferase YncA
LDRNIFKMKIAIRPYQTQDTQAILDIINYNILHSTALYDYNIRTYEQQKAILDDKLAKKFPVIVAEANGQVVGFGMYSEFRFREAYKFTVEHSVYVANGVEKCASIVTGYVATTADAAKSKPVDLYVERVVAKVQPTIDATYTADDGRKWIKIDGKDAIKVGVYGFNDIYAVVDGWGVADENGKAALVKQVKTAWNDENLGISVWTSPDYHRCSCSFHVFLL